MHVRNLVAQWFGESFSWVVQESVTVRKDRGIESAEDWHFLWCAFCEGVKARFPWSTQNQSILLLVWGWSWVQLCPWWAGLYSQIVCFGIICGGHKLSLSSATADLSRCCHFSHWSGQVWVELWIYSHLNTEHTWHGHEIGAGRNRWAVRFVF
jgi:hypothetical protein